MNIFALDRDPRKAAEYLVDAHVRKMVLESAQIMSTVHWMVDCCMAEAMYGRSIIYAPTHVSHPAQLWTARSLSNFKWLREHALAIEDERLWRFPHYNPHNSAAVIGHMPDPDMPDIGLTEFSLCFKHDYHSDNTVESYRIYYINEKAHLAEWTRRGAPIWWKETDT